MTNLYTPLRTRLRELSDKLALQFPTAICWQEWNALCTEVNDLYNYSQEKAVMSEPNTKPTPDTYGLAELYAYYRERFPGNHEIALQLMAWHVELMLSKPTTIVNNAYIKDA